jgi:dTDP-4-amino-4,6-dideoxygalactose transaminase
MSPSKPDVGPGRVTGKRRDFLPFFRPMIDDDDIRSVTESLRSGWLTTGPRTKELERRFGDIVGAPRSIAVNSCTSGLHVALSALGVGPGDEVVTTPYTFVATVEAILLVGALPVLVDVEPRRLNIDPERIAGAVGPKTRCILPVHMAGHPCDMDPILEIARGAGASVVEDAAHAFPAAYRGTTIGTLGDATVFSFYATKNLTAGEGGMITTRDGELADRIESLILHGMSRDAWKRYSEDGSWRYEVTLQGFKYNQSDILSSLALSQLAKIDMMCERRRRIVELYREGLGGQEAFDLPDAADHVEHAWHLFLLRLRPGVLRIDRAEFIREMRQRNVGCSVHFIPVHLHPFYRQRLGLAPEDLPVAVREYQRCLSLPLFPAMTDDDAVSVVEACLDIAERHRR